MKKYIAIALLMVLGTAYPAYARWSVGTAGGGAAAASATDYTQLASCVGAWYMNGSTTETDRSGEGHDLAVTASDTIPTSATVPTGYAGKSRDFEYTDTESLYLAEASCGSLDINGANAKITMAAWVNVESIANGDYHFAISKYAVSNKQYRLGMNGTDTNTWRVFCQLSAASDDGGNADAASGDTTNLGVGEWHHIACVANDTDIRVYVDGSLDIASPTAKTDGIYNGTGDFEIGATEGNTNNHDGLIDEVAVFNDALTATQIQEIYTSGLSGNTGGSD